MPDTGAPWNIPYVEATDLVRDWPTDSEALADAIADGLDAAGGLVAVKSAIFTSTQTNSTAAGGNFAVTDLTITHEVSDVSNKVVLFGSLGVVGSTNGRAGVGIAFAVDGTLEDVGDADGSRVPVSGQTRYRPGGTEGESAASLSFMTVHTPGSGSKTYTLRAINVTDSTHTVYINRNQSDLNAQTIPRGASSLILMEVKV